MQQAAPCAANGPRYGLGERSASRPWDLRRRRRESALPRHWLRTGRQKTSYGSSRRGVVRFRDPAVVQLAFPARPGRATMTAATLTRRSVATAFRQPGTPPAAASRTCLERVNRVLLGRTTLNSGHEDTRKAMRPFHAERRRAGEGEVAHRQAKVPAIAPRPDHPYSPRVAACAADRSPAPGLVHVGYPVSVIVYARVKSEHGQCLAVVMAIAEAHGGSVGVRPGAARGSFGQRLPANEDMQGQHFQASRARHPCICKEVVSP